MLNRTDKKKFETVLAIGAHPDDIEIGCGGTIKILTSLGYKVYALILTKGEKGGNPEVRVKEAKASAKILGIKKVFFPQFNDGKLHDDIEHINVVEEYIKRLKPNTVFTHTQHEHHQDHRNCSMISLAAARKVPTLLMYETQPNQFFEPHCYVNITNSFKFKLQSLTMHSSQIDKHSFDLGFIETLARYRGFQINVKYAESFEINHMLMNLKGPML